MLNDSMLGIKAQFDCELEKEELENQNKRLIAISHIHELAVKNPEIHHALLKFYDETLLFADKNNIKYSKINFNQIIEEQEI